MPKREVLSVAFKILGVYFLLQGTLGLLPLVMILVQGEIDAGGLVVFVIGWGVILGASLLLITRSDGLAARLAGRESGERRTSSVDMWGLQFAGFTVLGLFFALRGLGLIFALVSRIADTARHGVATPSWWTILGPVVMLLIGLRILFGSQLLVDLVKRAGNAGHARRENETD